VSNSNACPILRLDKCEQPPPRSPVERCHFRDCSHMVEKRCAVREALETGLLSQERYASYLKLKREPECLAAERQRHTCQARHRQASLARRPE
jgi:hypothetical protein